MTRRTIGLLVTLVLACLVAPLAAEAQPPTRVHRIGVLTGYTLGRGRNVEAFLEGMRALGYVEGQNLVLEYRGPAGQYERFPALAAELVRLKVDVLLAGGTLAATSRLPTVHNDRAYVEAGGLLCYGASHPDMYRRAATYVDKILKGAKPGQTSSETSNVSSSCLAFNQRQAESGRLFAYRGDLTGTDPLAIFFGAQITKRGTMCEQVIDDARDLVSRGDNG
jgi:ABC transporter substrate binding protein